MKKSSYFLGKETEVKDLGQGLKRQILAHAPMLMMVKVYFEEGAVGAAHHHPHRQVTYVESGFFEVSIGAETQKLSKGDGFFVAPDEVHGVVCLEAGALIDVFTPAREDFKKS